MKLLSEISEKILEIMKMPGLDQSTKSKYRQKLQVIRKEMRRLAADFAAYKTSGARYVDAYLLYNFPMNVAKTAAVIEEISLRYPGLLAGRKQLNILDIGCGSGAGIYGCYYALRDVPGIKEFNFMGIDCSHEMLEHARVLVRWLRMRDPRVRVRFLKRRIEDLYPLSIKGKYDFVMCINSLAEIVKKENIPLRFINSVFRCLMDGGLSIIIEPALKNFSRRLMRLRNDLVPKKGVQLLLPCLYDSPCALLEVKNRKEWCHQTWPWSPPEFLKIINQGINREIDVLKFSYLVVARTTDRLVKPGGHMVISNLLKEKGKQRCFICAAEGRIEIVRLDKSKSATNADFEKIGKGTIIWLENVVLKKEGYWQIAEHTKVKIVE